MRGELLPDSSQRKKKASLNTDSTALLKDTKQKKKVKCPNVKHNKLQMCDLKDSRTSTSSRDSHHHPQNNVSSSAGDNHCETTASTRDCRVGEEGAPSLLRSQAIESDVKDIKRYLKQLLMRVHIKEERRKVAAEWKTVALVLDRLFFFCYLAAIVISLATIFPKTY